MCRCSERKLTEEQIAVGKALERQSQGKKLSQKDKAVISGFLDKVSDDIMKDAEEIYRRRPHKYPSPNYIIG